MGRKEQKRFRRIVMRDLQDYCEAYPGWKTLSPSEKLQCRVSRLASFELNEGGLYLHSRAPQVRTRLSAISARAEEGWVSDLATLLLISFESTRLLNRLARRAPTYVKKFSSIMGCWPLLCKNQAKLSPQQLGLLEVIGLAKPDEFRIGVPQTPKSRGVVSKEAEFIFLWMVDHWRQGHSIGDQSGSAIALLLSEDKIWPPWYVKERSRVAGLINALKKKIRRPIVSTLRKVHGLAFFKDQIHHEGWSEVALEIYTALIDADIKLSDGRTGNPEDSASEQKSKRRGLFKKNFLQLLKGRPGAGRPRKTKGEE